jgi:hypothetical protein
LEIHPSALEALQLILLRRSSNDADAELRELVPTKLPAISNRAHNCWMLSGRAGFSLLLNATDEAAAR